MTHLLPRTKKENLKEGVTSPETSNVFRAQPFREHLVEDWTTSYGLPQIDIWEDSQMYLLEAALQGFHKSEISVEYENGYITMRGERDVPTLQNDLRKYIRKERSFDTFLRSFYIGQVEEEKIKVQYQKEILTIQVPKLNSKNQFTFKRIEVQ